MINIAGASEGRIAPLAAEIIQNQKGQFLIVVPTISRARRLQKDLSFFSALREGEEAPDIFILPPEEDGVGAYEAKSNDSLLQRMNVLRKVTGGKNCVVIAPVTGAIKKLPPKGTFEENLIRLKTGEDVNLAEIRERLSLLGYERVSMIETKGEYSIRGGIIDIFTPEGDDPYRIELFDTEIDSIRTFDIQTQRSKDVLSEITIYQYSQIARDEEVFAKAAAKIRRAYSRQIKKLPELEEALAKRRDRLLEYIDGMINIQYLEKFLNYFYEETDYIWDYMDNPTVMVDDPSRILETLEGIKLEQSYEIEDVITRGLGIKEEFDNISGEADFFKLYDLPDSTKKDGYIFTPFVMTIRGPHGAGDGPRLKELRQVQTRQIQQYGGNMETFRGDVESYIAKGFDITIVCGTEERMNNMIQFVDHEKFNSRQLPGRYKAGKVHVERGILTAGIELTEERKCFIWDGDVFGESRRSRRKSSSNREKNAEKIREFADLEAGDYVVHEAHGIGRFTGIQQLEMQGTKQDFLTVEYGGADKLYIPVDQLGKLQKYIGGEGIKPKVNRLSTNEWKVTKAKAVAAVSDMAEEIINLARVRRSTPGHAFGEDTTWQKEFEDSFPYTETEDQLRCVEEIKEDMEKPYPMDRLLCGDVGFGKTEVAARALFKCVIEGKQAAVLVPTTLLANQHYYTLKSRFEKYPVRVEMLSRFRTPAQQEKIVDDMAKGAVDMIIGTHRLLSKDIKFKDLGLLVIDEEQRFGVAHKEKIKTMRENVDVLTLSATPIPRTLHMSLSGMRDMSTIDEPPEDRYPVQTYVMEEDDFLIREAIEKEMGRDGQVYILYNKVKSIRMVADRIKNLVPEAAIAVGHGQMNERELEDIIMDFASGHYDVLISTTIIESGMDIPNANTMIVLDADHFGLAQLYQLRGRVGRSGRIAYTYLMYQRDKVLTEIAEKRLKAIRDFTEFGSGFKIAMRDLELRGAGNLIGKEQSGHMLEIGYELYCKLLDDAIKLQLIRQEEGDEAAEAYAQGEGKEMEGTSINLPISAIIPSRYIDDEILKLQMYKKISYIKTEENLQDITDELIDRFGDPPVETQNLLNLALIKSKASRMGVKDISHQGYKLKFTIHEKARFEEDTVPNLIKAYGGKVRFNGGKNPFISLTVGVTSPEPGKPAPQKYVRSIIKEMELFFQSVQGENSSDRI